MLFVVAPEKAVMNQLELALPVLLSPIDIILHLLVSVGIAFEDEAPFPTLAILILQEH